MYRKKPRKACSNNYFCTFIYEYCFFYIVSDIPGWGFLNGGFQFLNFQEVFQINPYNKYQNSKSAIKHCKIKRI